MIPVPLPVNEAQFMDRLQGEGGLCHVELRRLLSQGVLLHQECHHVTFGEDLC